MNKGLIEAILKKGTGYIDQDIYKNIKMLSKDGYDKQKIRNILLNAGFDLIDVDDALGYYFRRKKKNKS